jgi:hypothetical protein
VNDSVFGRIDRHVNREQPPYFDAQDQHGSIIHTPYSNSQIIIYPRSLSLTLVRGITSYARLSLGVYVYTDRVTLRFFVSLVIS